MLHACSKTNSPYIIFKYYIDYLQKKNTNFVYCCQVNRYWLKSKKIKSFIGNFINVKNMM